MKIALLILFLGFLFTLIVFFIIAIVVDTKQRKEFKKDHPCQSPPFPLLIFLLVFLFFPKSVFASTLVHDFLDSNGAPSAYADGNAWASSSTGAYCPTSNCWGGYNYSIPSGDISLSYVYNGVNYSQSGANVMWGVYDNSGSFPGNLRTCSLDGGVIKTYNGSSWQNFNSFSSSLAGDHIYKVTWVGTSFTCYIDDVQVAQITVSSAPSTLKPQVYLQPTSPRLKSITDNIAGVEPTSTPTPTPTAEPTPTSAPTPTPTTSFTEPILTPTPATSNSPYQDKPYLHEACNSSSKYLGVWQTINDAFEDPESAFSNDGEAYYGETQTSGTARVSGVYRIDSLQLPNDITLEKIRVDWFAKSNVSYAFDVRLLFSNDSMSTVSQLIGTGVETNILFQESGQNHSFWFLHDFVTDTLAYTPSRSWITQANSELALFMMFDIPSANASNFLSMKYPNVCFYYYDSNPEGAITSIPSEKGGATYITGNSSTPNPANVFPDTCEFNPNSVLNIPYYFCELKRWFVNALNYLFVPTSSQITGLSSQISSQWGKVVEPFNSELTSIITKPLDLIESITTQTCQPLHLDFNFAGVEFDLPCPRTFVENLAPSLITLWDVVSTGLISYWVIVKIFGIVKNGADPQDDKIEVTEI